jgi:hypothetical protein
MGTIKRRTILQRLQWRFGSRLDDGVRRETRPLSQATRGIDPIDPNKKGNIVEVRVYGAEGATQIMAHCIRGFRLLSLTFLLALSPDVTNAQTCLHPDRQLGWINGCSYPVRVRWTDEGNCRNWSCSTGVPARGRNTTYFKGQMQWCECRGSGCNPGSGPRCD